MAAFTPYRFSHDANVSLGNTKYAHSRRELNKVINDLKAIGTDEIVRLPKIAVIGNQSAGKSSLIEAISQIQVPRAGGTCTRCPMEVSLTSSDHVGGWQGKVSLRLETDLPNGRRPGVYLFGTTTVKEHIPKILRRAQLAILNPARNYADFINLPDDKCENFPSAKMFSTNTVVLEITGADVDVSFIDLPGIISNVPNVVSLLTMLTCSQAIGI
jgi:GTPase SAR1 family protein